MLFSMWKFLLLNKIIQNDLNTLEKEKRCISSAAKSAYIFSTSVEFYTLQLNLLEQPSIDILSIKSG